MTLLDKLLEIKDKKNSLIDNLEDNATLDGVKEVQKLVDKLTEQEADILDKMKVEENTPVVSQCLECSHLEVAKSYNDVIRDGLNCKLCGGSLIPVQGRQTTRR